MKYTIIKYSVPIVLFAIYLLATYAPVIAQTNGSPQEAASSTAMEHSQGASTSTELSVAVSIVFPPGGEDTKTVLKPGDPFAIQISAPNMGITDASVNYDELGIGIVPVSDSGNGTFTTQMRGLPFISTGLKHYTVMFKDSLGNQHSITKTVAVDATKPTGSLTATFTKVSGSLAVHLSGSIDGTGSDVQIVNASVYGVNVNGAYLGGNYPDIIPTTPGNLSLIDTDLRLPMPDDTWAQIGYGITLKDAAGNSASIRSTATPVASIEGQPRINHALSGSIVEPVPHGGVPAGVGIPHALINSLPVGNYYAVVFFEGLQGCPSDNYEFTSFIDDNVWGVDEPVGGYDKAHSTSAGGCMQLYHVDPSRGEGWQWGALSNTGSANAIADPDGIPAFALCDEAATCDTIAPQAATSTSSSSGNPPSAASGISSVMFLPGIKGSKLYENNPLCLIPSDDCNIPLWLPLADIATPELFMDESGKSKRRIYVQEGGILSGAHGLHFYDTFAQKMNQAEESHIYGSTWQWKPIAYDWRMSLPDIVNNGAQYGNRIYYEDATSTPYIEQSLRALASSSPTGKVTIIAHSNGGLVAKELLKKLGDAEAARLVDTVIMVGTPQSGAPRALGALLYGDSEGIPAVGRFANLIMSSIHAREFALNSPMAYHLLPSATYVAAKNPTYPLIKFGNGALLAHQRALYGDTIDTDDELQEYLLGGSGARSAPETSDLTHAAVARANLLSDAANMHESLDAWSPPPGIQVYQIAGYGVDTISGIDTYEVPTKNGADVLSYLPLFTQEGDGTVPVISSLMMNAISQVHSIWVDMSRLSTGSDYSHGTMFEVPDIEETIDTILQTPLSKASTTMTLYAAPMNNNELSSEPQKRISFFVHSLSSLTVTDIDGNQTQVHADGTSVQDIPGSESGIFGNVEYVTLPADNTYSLSLADVPPGTATLDMQNRNGAEVTATSTIAYIPMTASSVVNVTVEGSIGQSSSVQVDENGDGTTDLSITPVIGETLISPDIPTQNNATSTASYVRTVVTEHIQKVLDAARALAKPLGFLATNPAASSSVPVEQPIPVPSVPVSSSGKQGTVFPAPSGASTSISQEKNRSEIAPTPLVRSSAPTHEEHLSWWTRLVRAIKKMFSGARSFLRL